jgi:hypothetical protein
MVYAREPAHDENDETTVEPRVSSHSAVASASALNDHVAVEALLGLAGAAVMDGIPGAAVS